MGYKYTIILEPGKTEREYFRDIWRYRELFYFLALRDILVRYKQTVIGILWAVLRPFITMIVFSIVFGRLAKLPSDGIPYPLFVYAAMLPWQFFSSSLSESAGSLVANSNLLTKVYFPRLIVPTSTVVVTFVDFLISTIILCVLMVWYQYVPTWRILFLPILMIAVFFAAMGPGLLLAALNVKFRDFRYIIPFLVQFGLYISPVGFSSSIIPEKWRLLYSLNPIVGIIDGFRWSILGKSSLIYIPSLITSISFIIVFLVIGVLYFRKMEKNLADII